MDKQLKEFEDQRRAGAAASQGDDVVPASPSDGGAHGVGASPHTTPKPTHDWGNGNGILAEGGPAAQPA